jgi:hypothetical protein
MNGQTPFLVPWPAAFPFQLQGQLSKLTGLQTLQQAAAVQPATHPHHHHHHQAAAAAAAAAAASAAVAGMPFGQYSPFTTITIPGGQVYLPSLSLPPTLLTHNAVTSSLPKLILPTIKVTILQLSA